MTIQKQYLYRVYDPSNNYLGLLKNVISDFTYNQNIATSFAQCTITVNQSADTSALPPTPILDETGSPVLDEGGNAIKDDGSATLVGDYASQINENNIIQVWEISSYYPNGILRFTGYISKWEADFGGDDNITITTLSLGNDLSEYLVSAGDTAYITQNTDNANYFGINTYSGVGKGGGQYVGAGQSFKISSSAIQLGAISLEVSTPEAGQFVLEVFQGSPTNGYIFADPLVTSVTYNVAGALSEQVLQIPFGTPTTLSASTEYYFIVYWYPTNTSSTNLANIYANSTSPYTNGVGFGVGSSGTYNFATNWNSGSLYFIIWQYGTSTTGTFTNEDPSQILTSVMQNYNQQGGRCAIPSTTLTPLIRNNFIDTQYGGAYWGTAYAQAFTPSANTTFNILELQAAVSANNGSFSAQIIKGNPANDSASVIGGSYVYVLGSGNTVVASSSGDTISNTTGAKQYLTFSSPVNLVAGTQYYILMQWAQGGYGYLEFYGASSSDSLGSQIGKLYQSLATINNASFNPTYNSAQPALYFGLYYQNPLPTSFTSGYNPTGTTTSYPFTSQTILQAVQTVVNLSPANYYWYVDPATNILYFDKYHTTPDIMIIKGKHIDVLKMVATKENIVNVVYFTGGASSVSGQSIFVVVYGTQGSNRRGMTQLSDNRVSTTNLGSDANAQAVANLIAQNFINNNSQRVYQTTLTILDITMDTTILKLGKTVGFSGFGTFIDSLVIPIVGVNPSPDSTTLQIGSLPQRSSQAVQQILSQLQYLQTVNNPSSPSP